METTTQEIEMTTTRIAPIELDSVTGLQFFYLTGHHGYCTVRRTVEDMRRFDVYCQIHGDEVLLQRDLSDASATSLVNHANAASFSGEEI
jgi:hypothetical protein